MNTRVLLTNFEAGNRARVAACLKQSGFQAIVSDPSSLYPIDAEAVIVDASANPSRAFASLAQLREAGVLVPAVVLSESGDWDTMHEARRLGAHVVTTPVANTTLRLALTAAASSAGESLAVQQAGA